MSVYIFPSNRGIYSWNCTHHITSSSIGGGRHYHARKWEIYVELRSRINKAWEKWGEVSGVVCVKKMQICSKGKICKTVLEPELF